MGTAEEAPRCSRSALLQDPRLGPMLRFKLSSLLGEWVSLSTPWPIPSNYITSGQADRFLVVSYVFPVQPDWEGGLGHAKQSVTINKKSTDFP